MSRVAECLSFSKGCGLPANYKMSHSLAAWINYRYIYFMCWSMCKVTRAVWWVTKRLTDHLWLKLTWYTQGYQVEVLVLLLSQSMKFPAAPESINSSYWPQGGMNGLITVPPPGVSFGFFWQFLAGGVEMSCTPTVQTPLSFYEGPPDKRFSSSGVNTWGSCLASLTLCSCRWLLSLRISL